MIPLSQILNEMRGLRGDSDAEHPTSKADDNKGPCSHGGIPKRASKQFVVDKTTIKRFYIASWSFAGMCLANTSKKAWYSLAICSRLHRQVYYHNSSSRKTRWTRLYFHQLCISKKSGKVLQVAMSTWELGGRSAHSCSPLFCSIDLCKT